jgi:uncharacterized membrane protein YtjA (UPF0391 family)
MLYAGMFFFSLAIVSGLYAFADITTAPADLSQTIFYAFLLLASLSFALCLGRVTAGRDNRVGRHIDDRRLRVAGAEPLWKGD